MIFVKLNYFSLFLVMAGIHDDQQPIQIEDWSKLRVFNIIVSPVAVKTSHKFFRTTFTVNILLFQVHLP